MAFLIVFGVGIFAATSVDFSDRGDCVLRSDGQIAVRQPDSSSFKDSEFCIIIQT